MVIELNTVFFHMVFEMDVRDGPAEIVLNLGKRQVVGGNQSNGSRFDEFADNTFRADSPVMGVGSTQ